MDHPKNLVEFGMNTFYTSGISDIYICFDFKDYRVQLTQYSILSYNYESDCSKGFDPKGPHLRNWVIEVSDDGKHWTIIDEQRNCSYLCDLNITCFFNTENTGKFSRFVKLRHIGNSWFDSPNGDHYVAIKCIEFYGKLRNQKEMDALQAKKKEERERQALTL